MSRCTVTAVLRDLRGRPECLAGNCEGPAAGRVPLTLPPICVYIALTSARRVTEPDGISTSEQGLTSPRGGLTGDPTDFTLKQAGYVTGPLPKNSR